MKQNNSRDLLLLATVAFRKQKFDKAGQLFAAALCSDDADELLRELDVEGTLVKDMQDDWGTGLAGDAPRTNFAKIAGTLSDAMSHMSLSSSDDGEDEDEVQMPALADVEDEDSDDDDTSDDFSGDIPGQKVLTSSLSSDRQGGGSTKKVRLVLGAGGPVRVK